ncbi:hypothetical protein GCM10025864_14220 [Luteimicrobium album]|uniref:FAD dependent oxidoreductase n=1 Tax=Luteimicrobium album TaxID=1054550 RepID=A0ABQ6I141_9MICO|nr:FAD-dependent oxidoreductase [Luteimicrobium album]GMA23663.1 hypothetical protein GCM10025864_14220 [Luteimicrobium album]
MYSDGTYDIPLRVLYARDLANLWVAGRDISASHVAFGSTRVMATCAILGEAVGIAAAVAAWNGCRPQQVATTHLTELRRALVRADASVQGIGHDDPEDLALQARVTASSTSTQLTVPPEPAAESLALDRSIGVVLPVDPALEEIRLLVEADEPTTVGARLHATSHPRNYLPGAEVAKASVDVSSTGPTWVALPLVWRPAEPANAFLVLDSNPHLRLVRAASPVPGVTTLVLRDLPAEPLDDPREWRAWKRLAHRDLPVLDAGPTTAWSPDRAVGGFARPWGGPQLWVSQPLDRDPQPTLTLDWDHTVTFSEVAVVLDDDVEEDLINLHHHTTPFDVVPELVRDYRVEALLADTWTTVAHVTGNRRRHVRHRLEVPVRADAVRLVVLATNGAPCAHVSGLRVWR